MIELMTSYYEKGSGDKIHNDDESGCNNGGGRYGDSTRTVAEQMPGQMRIVMGQIFGNDINGGVLRHVIDAGTTEINDGGKGRETMEENKTRTPTDTWEDDN